MNSQEYKCCIGCGEIFYRPRKYSSKQWSKSVYCSLQCSGKSKRGVPRSENAKKKLSDAHRGTKKPWAGKYKRTQAHRDAIREGLARLPKEFREEMSRKGSEAKKGRKASEATKEKMREIARNRPGYKGDRYTKAEMKAFCQRRREARKRANGGHTIDEWEAIKEVYQHTCPSCMEEGVFLTADHILPISAGGSDNIENIQPLCRACNLRKMITPVQYLPVFYQFGSGAPFSHIERQEDT